ncbi:hypothetical protein [Paraclostridium bifermentans]|uniref:hypothetical protein n=1 Tax=Paraclostridium bifermentans TaxID=1490 RepID=UPI001157CBDB|nr:hypothetical protein [Paraclostridium bifermentans]TQO59332.1 hypothetical protein D5S05_02350 [Paraclostridium bifermentans]
MALELVKKNEATGWYEGKGYCYVCGREYEIKEENNAKLVAHRPGRYDSDGYYIEFRVYSKCTHCSHNNMHDREAKINEPK